MKKLNLISVFCLITVAILSSCKTSEEKQKTELEDCSAIFETRYADNNKIYKDTAQKQSVAECKILEIKIDEDTKCEIVGSNQINNLKENLAQNKNDKFIIIAPEKKFRELANSANKYLVSNGLNIQKYLDSEIFNNLKFPYKGMKCEINKSKTVIWTGGKQIILIIEKK